MMLFTSLFQPLSPPPLSFFTRCRKHIRALEEAIREEDPEIQPAPPSRGLLFREAPYIAEATAGAIGARPELFESGEARPLHLHQARAAGWLTLHLGLQRLADLTGANYRREQSTASRIALDQLRDARESARRPRATYADQLRLAALAIPEAVVRRWQKRTTGKKKL